MAQSMKTVEEIFGDYQVETNIKKASIVKINLFKKSNKLEMDLLSSVYLFPSELLEFEKYLKERFVIENIEIRMQYEEETVIPSMEQQWKQIVKYMAHKYPFTEFLLHNSHVHIEDTKVKVSLAVKGADFLTARGFDKTLEKTLKSLYAKRYKVIYVENLQEEDMKKIEQKCKLTEKYEIEKAISEMGVEEEIEEKEEEENKQDNVPKEEQPPIPEEPIEKTPLILGRSANIKDTLVKVDDISIDSGKIALEG